MDAGYTHFSLGVKYFFFAVSLIMCVQRCAERRRMACTGATVALNERAAHPTLQACAAYADVAAGPFRATCDAPCDAPCDARAETTHPREPFRAAPTPFCAIRSPTLRAGSPSTRGRC